MKNLFRFSFRPKPLLGGLCIFVVLLFGGVTAKHNSLVLGATSSYAVTVSPPPAKHKAAHKGNRLYNRIMKKLLRRDGPIYGADIAIIGGGILLILLLGLWTVSLYLAGAIIAGAFVGILTLAALVLFIVLLASSSS